MHYSKNAPELLHEAQKLTLADSIWSISGKKDVTLSNNVQYVLDGGALLLLQTFLGHILII